MVSVSDFGTVAGVEASTPRIAIAIALKHYPAGKHMCVMGVKFNKKSKKWTVNFGYRR